MRLEEGTAGGKGRGSAEVLLTPEVQSPDTPPLSVQQAVTGRFHARCCTLGKQVGRKDTASSPGEPPITAPLPHQLPPRQGVVLPRPLHLHFPQVQKRGQEKRREERREPRASFTPTLHLLHVALDTGNHSRTSLTP